ncbi:hypothetical protein G9A89_017131 [Geosiphon pyriformis]|nr:hypothetical protein G9A89_017131 [Geosiphon pyriformis]
MVCHFAPNEFLYNFRFTNSCLVQFGSGIRDIYTDGLVKNLGSVSACNGATAYFLCVNLDVSIRVYGLLSSTLAELQAIAFTLDCVLASSSVVLYMDSQTSLGICASLNCSVDSDFCKKCRIEKEHIYSTIISKNLSVAWVKIKSHSVIVGNKHADFFADAATNLKFVLLNGMMYYFLAVKGRPVLDNAFWHPDDSICSGFSSSAFTVLRSYFIKALHHHLPTVKRKRLYKLSYPSILCIHCGFTDDSDHVFLCEKNTDAKKKLISNMVSNWANVLGTGYAGCSINWVDETMSVLGPEFNRELLIVNMICDFAADHRSAIWVPNARLRAYYEKHSLLLRNESPAPAVSGLASWWSHRKICNFGVKLGIHMCFGLHPELANLHFGFLCDFSVVDNLGV